MFKNDLADIGEQLDTELESLRVDVLDLKARVAALEETEPPDPDPPDPDHALGHHTHPTSVPHLEWSRASNTINGVNAWDAIATATFTHRQTGREYRTPWYYDEAAGAFRLRFTPPEEGVYDITTASIDAPNLRALTGIVTATPAPAGRKGYLTTDGPAFAHLDGKGARARTLYNIFQRHNDSSDPAGWETPAHIPRDTNEPTNDLPARIDEILDETERHGMQATLIMLAHNLTRFPSAYNTPYQQGDETPDATTFHILEALLQRAHERGMFIHFWRWADHEARGSSVTLPGGINGWLDQRLNRYLVARLGAYPNWSMSYGYDLNEWVTPEQVRAWAASMHEWSTLPRVLMARESQDDATHQTPFYLGADKLDAYSLDQRPTGGFFEDARARFAIVNDAMPVAYERRFLHTRNNVWSMSATRRALWQFTMAGGAAGIYGTLWGPGPDYPNPEQLRTHARFWKHRYPARFTPDANPVDGLVTRAADGRVIAYKEDTNDIRVALTAGARVTAVDAAREHEELDLGVFTAGVHTLNLPWSSDWAVTTARVTSPEEPPRELSMRGDPTFAPTNLTTAQRERWNAIHAQIKNPPQAHVDWRRRSENPCLWWMGHYLQSHATAALTAFRVTGDLTLLDHVTEIAAMHRDDLRDGWFGTVDAPEGHTDGFLNWRHYTNSNDVTRGTDRRVEYDMDAHAFISMIAAAQHQNRDLASPAGHDYGKLASEWREYLTNDFEAKLRARNNVAGGVFPILDRPYTINTYCSWLKWHYYMGVLTGDARYTREAERMSGVLEDELVRVDAPDGNAVVWKRSRQDPPASGGYGDYLMPTTYADYVYLILTELHLERFSVWADASVLRRMARGFRHFVVDNDDPVRDDLARTVGGEQDRAGITYREGRFRRITPALYARGSYALLSAFDGTGELAGLAGAQLERAGSRGYDTVRVLAAMMLTAHGS